MRLVFYVEAYSFMHDILRYAGWRELHRITCDDTVFVKMVP